MIYIFIVLQQLYCVVIKICCFWSAQMVDVAGAVGGSMLGFIMPTAIMLKMTYDRAIRNDDGGELQVFMHCYFICGVGLYLYS